jgi:5-methylcytosine-specific restriction endonuclease McrA
VEKQCVICATRFVAKRRAGRPLCSARCARRHRELLYGRTVRGARRQAILERDNWVCGICGEPITKRAGTDPDSPSIDHIVPRFLGGTSDEENLRAAHIKCNSRRSYIAEGLV